MASTRTKIVVGMMLAALVGIGIIVARAQATVAPLMHVANLDEQRISGADTIIVPNWSPFEQLNLSITVGVDGNVEAAEVIGKQSKLVVDTALATVRQWKMRPQQFEGRPIRANGIVTLYVLVPEIPPDASPPLPNVPPGQIEISLERRGCYGNCPAYSVSVTGEGKVRFSAGRNGGLDPRTLKLTEYATVILPGQHDDRVDPKAVAVLLERFRAANFAGMRPEYRYSITHGSTYFLTLRLGNKSKQVIDYLGRDAGMPAVVTELQDAVDALTQSKRWVHGNGQTAAWLKTQGFDFRSQAAIKLLLHASFLNRDDGEEHENFAALVRSFLAEGLDLNSKVPFQESNGQGQRLSIGSIIASYAAEHGHEGLFDLMLDQGQYKLMTKTQLNEAFLTGMGCNKRIAMALVAAGADPKAKSQSGNALHAIVGYSERCGTEGGASRREMAATLVALGVPVDARNEQGSTPLFGLNDPVVAAILLKAGANPNETNSDGVPAVLVTDDDRVALLLLSAGANPRARHERETLRQKAKRKPLPATLAWLDQHGIK